MKDNKYPRRIIIPLLLSMVFSACSQNGTAENTVRETAKTSSHRITFQTTAAQAAAENEIVFPEDTAYYPDTAYDPPETMPETEPGSTTEAVSKAVEKPSDTKTLPPETTAFDVTELTELTVPTAHQAAAAGMAETETEYETTAAGTVYVPEISTTAIQTTARTEKAAPERITPEGYNVIGDNNILVSYQNGHFRGLMPCFGTYGLCDGWVNGVNEFARLLPDVRVYNMVVPTSSEFYVPDELFDGFTTKQLNKIRYISDRLMKAENVDAYSALSLHTDEEIYSRTDHHWAPLGAYYAAEAFSKTADFAFPALSEYRAVTKGGYVGSLYGYSNDINLKNDPEDFTMYISPNNDALKVEYYNTFFEAPRSAGLFVSPDASAYYCSYLGADNIIAHIGTDAGGGRTLVIFKDSYGNALVPFLTSGFENIYVCDLRYFDLNAADFCRDVNATDLLFAVCTYTPAGTNGKYINAVLGE